MQTSELYLVVNRAIGRFPGFLFLPIPLLCIFLVAFGTSISLTLFLGLGIGAVIILGMFLSLTWLFVVGQDPIRFAYSLLPPPNWVRGRCSVISILEQDP
ncbi:MAG: hypothetical protein AAFP20_00740 [Cyanobacteria bacterium J06614_10]